MAWMFMWSECIPSVYYMDAKSVYYMDAKKFC